MIKIFAKEVDLEIPDQLRGLVLAFILGTTSKKVQEKIPVFPTGFPSIVYVFGSIPKVTIDGKLLQVQSRTIVAGQIYNVKINSEVDGIYGQLGIVLHPSAPYYLFHTSGEKIRNRWTPFEEVSPINSASFLENLCRDLSNEERLGQIVKYLQVLEKNRLPKIEWLEKVLLRIFEQNGNIDQTDLLESSGVCSRHFRRVFRKIIGVPPKYFCKVVQMNTAFEAINRADPVKLHHIALDCGYYDQSHFINDFQKMFGGSPDKFLNGRYAYIKNYMGRWGT